MTTQVLQRDGHGLIPHPSLGDLMRLVTSYFLLLPIGGAIALAWANLAPESYFTTVRPLTFYVNDIGMALFFALVTQEVVEAVMPGGALHTWRRWMLPVIASAGASAAAAALYFAYVSWRGELVLWNGWPIAIAIDIAVSYVLIRALFKRHPAIPFVLVLSVPANVLGLIVIASRREFVEVQPGGIVLLVVALALAVQLRQWKVRTFWPYLLICGPIAWVALYLEGLNPALALVPIVPFMPHRPRDLHMFEDAPHGPHDSPRHLEHVLNYPVHVVLFFFGLVNAGVLLSGYGTGTWALLAATLVGKPLGLLAATALAVAAGFHLPRGLHWHDLAVIAFAVSGGFAFALFFATAAFPLGPILGELKIGAIASGIGLLISIAIARWNFPATGKNPRSRSV